MDLRPQDFTTGPSERPNALAVRHNATGLRFELLLWIVEIEGTPPDMEAVEKRALYDVGKLPAGMSENEAVAITREAMRLWDWEGERLVDGLR